MMIPSGYLLHSHGIDGPNRNRWFTVLKNGGSFHGYVSHNQMVYGIYDGMKSWNESGISMGVERREYAKVP